MTEPGTRATSVRRTVTVAAALVASQAVLCAVIGWVTFADKEPAQSRPQAAEPLLGPPIVVPPAGVAPVTTPPGNRPTKSGRAPGIASKRTVPPTRASVSPAPHRIETPVTVKPSASRAGTSLEEPATPPPSAAQNNAEIGRKCDPKGADGITADGKAVVCLFDDAGNLVWQIV